MPSEFIEQMPHYPYQTYIRTRGYSQAHKLHATLKNVKLAVRNGLRYSWSDTPIKVWRWNGGEYELWKTIRPDMKYGDIEWA